MWGDGGPGGRRRQAWRTSARRCSRWRRRRSSSGRAPRPTRAGSSRGSASSARCSSRTRASPRPATRRRVRAAAEAAGIEVVVYDRARVEPTLDSLQDAADFARDAGVDGFVSVGGGSSIDTAKVANLIVAHPAPVMDYVNPPVGEGRTPPGPLRPHLAIPTTSGTGSEATTVAVLDIPEQRVKTGISHRYLRPSQAIVDPELTRTLGPRSPPRRASTWSATRRSPISPSPTTGAPRPASPDERPPYQGANPVADVWSAKALEYGGRFLRRAVADADDVEARGAMMLAATMAGVGLRLGGRPHPARVRVSDRRPEARVPAAGLSRRPSVRAARALRDRHRAGRVPVHLRGRARAPRSRGRAAGRRAARRAGARRAAAARCCR